MHLRGVGDVPCERVRGKRDGGERGVRTDGLDARDGGNGDGGNIAGEIEYRHAPYDLLCAPP